MRVSKLTIICILAIVSGCAPQKAEEYVTKGYLSTSRQLPPEPVYNRVTMARPPEVMPVRDIEFAGAPRVLPVIHLDLKGVTLETVAQTLGGSARYQSYTAASIANRKFSIDALGTIDELADTISKKAHIYVSVDHANLEVRFLPRIPTSPELYSGKIESKVEGHVD